MKTISAILVLLLSISQGNAQSVVKVTEKFYESHFVWQSGRGGVYARYTIFPDQNGVLVLCGAVAMEGHSQMQFNRKAWRANAFYVNKKPVVTGLSYFKTVNSRSKLIGANAKCKSTGLKEPKGRYTFNIYAKKTRFRD